MNVIKRDGSEAVFDQQKIFTAIKGVNNDLTDEYKLDDEKIQHVTDHVVKGCEDFNRALSVEEIQDIVERQLSRHGYHEAAKQYILYRYKRAIARQKNTTDDAMLALIDGTNEEMNQENSNKNPRTIAVQRDYMAGMVSKDLCRRVLYPKDVIEAHDKGIIHIHK